MHICFCISFQSLITMVKHKLYHSLMMYIFPFFLLLQIQCSLNTRIFYLHFLMLRNQSSLKYTQILFMFLPQRIAIICYIFIFSANSKVFHGNMNNIKARRKWQMILIYINGGCYQPSGLLECNSNKTHAREIKRSNTYHIAFTVL